MHFLRALFPKVPPRPLQEILNSRLSYVNDRMLNWDIFARGQAQKSNVREWCPLESFHV